MATTKKDGAPAKEIRPSPTPATPQNRRPRAIIRPSSPAPSSSEKTAAPPAAAKKPTPNYLKPTFSSSTEAARHAMVQAPGTAKATSQKSPSTKKVLPQRSASSNARMQTKPVLTSRSSFSERTLKGKTTQLPRRADSLPRRTPVVRTKGKCSSVASSVASGASSPKAMTEETMSNEDREAALDILDLDLEEHILLEIPALEDKMALAEEPGPEESDDVADELAAFQEDRVPVPDPVVLHPDDAKTSNREQQHGEVDDASQVTEKEEIVAGDEDGDEQELPTFETVAEEKAVDPDETEEKILTAAAASCGYEVKEDAAAKVESESEERGKEGGDGSDEKIEPKATNEEAAASSAAEPEKEKKKSEATQEQHQQQQGKKGPAPAYNDVIEETASRLVEKRKSKVKALVGAFETVIVLDSGGHAQ